MFRQSLRGAFASSTKYLRQSSRPNLQRCTRSSSLPHQVSFFLQRNISRCLCDHRMLPVCAASFSVSREGSTLSKRNRRQSRCPPAAACLHDISSSHGQLIREAVLQHLEITFSCCRLIVFSSHSQCFTSLAHLRNSSLFVAATS